MVEEFVAVVVVDNLAEELVAVVVVVDNLTEELGAKMEGVTKTQLVDLTVEHLKHFSLGKPVIIIIIIIIF